MKLGRQKEAKTLERDKLVLLYLCGDIKSKRFKDSILTVKNFITEKQFIHTKGKRLISKKGKPLSLKVFGKNVYFYFFNMQIGLEKRQFYYQLGAIKKFLESDDQLKKMNLALAPSHSNISASSYLKHPHNNGRYKGLLVRYNFVKTYKRKRPFKYYLDTSKEGFKALTEFMINNKMFSEYSDTLYFEWGFNNLLKKYIQKETQAKWSVDTLLYLAIKQFLVISPTMVSLLLSDSKKIKVLDEYLKDNKNDIETLRSQFPKAPIDVYGKLLKLFKFCLHCDYISGEITKEEFDEYRILKSKGFLVSKLFIKKAQLTSEDKRKIYREQEASWLDEYNSQISEFNKQFSEAKTIGDKFSLIYEKYGIEQALDYFAKQIKGVKSKK